jgi:hypothetical protein
MPRHLRWLCALALLVLILDPGFVAQAQTLSSPRSTPSGEAAPTDPASLPVPAQAVISATLGREDPPTMPSRRGAVLTW